MAGSDLDISPHVAADPDLRDRFRRTLDALDAAGVAKRLADRDHRLWREDPSEIADRLGWLDVVDWMRPRLPEVRAWAEGIRSEARDVVLLGMGGSSLAPEVFFRILAGDTGGTRLHVLDSTSPAWIRRVTGELGGDRFHVLVASKSGTTIEVRTLHAHFREHAARLGGDPARFFTAITDPGTPLHAEATTDAFAGCFANPPDIGGRYSALSYFGLVPAAVCGVDVDRLLAGASDMAEACREERATRNPGLRLGAWLGAGVAAGRDKLTLLASPDIAPFGLWVEQLVAESTGKDGTGIVPVTEEPPVDPGHYGDDRLFLALRLADDEELAARVAALEAAGHPVARIEWDDATALGAEMYRWEVATAVAGHLLRIHPFDQPDVQATKTRTSEILARLAAGESAPAQGEGDAAALLAETAPGDYVAIMTYGDPTPETGDAVRRLRRALVETRGIATTWGVGPRFLHSTGQLHKGGPPGVRALSIVADEGSLPIPGEAYGFDDLITAQAAGDLAALRAAGRRAVSRRVPAGRVAETLLDLAAGLR